MSSRINYNLINFCVTKDHNFPLMDFLFKKAHAICHMYTQFQIDRSNPVDEAVYTISLFNISQNL